MKANELRIGNLVYLPNGNCPISVSRDMYEYTEGLANIEDYRPIPLTEEWPAKFGFPDLVELAIFICNNSKFKYIEITSEDLKDLKVHQLQNLYFALAGEELEIKETVQ